MVAATKLKTIQKAVQIAGTLTGEALRNGSIKKNPEKKGSRENLVRMGMEGTITRGIGWEMLLLQPQTLLGESTWNQVMAVNGGHGRRNQGNQERERAFMLGVKEARQDLNIVTEPSDLAFSYEIEIASGLLVEIDKVIKECKLERESHLFDINLIPLGSESFDIIIGKDWVSNHRDEIICHEKVVRIPLPGSKEEIMMVRDYPEVFADDLSGLPPNREIEFRIELIPRAIPVAKSPYRLAPSELEELSDEAYKSKYFVHIEADKMYYDLIDMYWWPGMKKDIAVYVRPYGAGYSILSYPKRIDRLAYLTLPMFYLVWIVSPKVMTQSAGRPSATSRGRGTSRRVGRGGGRTKGCPSDQGDGRIDDQGGQVGGLGRKATKVEVKGDVRNVIENNDRMGCTYKEFLACNPKEYDGSYMVELLNLHTGSRCRCRLVPHLVTSKGKRIKRNGSIKKNLEKRRSGEHLVTIGTEGTITRGLGREMLLLQPQILLGESTRDYGVVPMNVNLINARNPFTRTCYEYGSTDHIKAARGRAFMLGAEEARQDPNIMMDAFTLNNHYATSLFDSGVDYSFVSTTFIPLLNIEPSYLDFSYEIKIASGKLVEIDRS
nr:hypothetical protein [Tanacetum cinerariifolium]